MQDSNDLLSKFRKRNNVCYSLLGFDCDETELFWDRIVKKYAATMALGDIMVEVHISFN